MTKNRRAALIIKDVIAAAWDAILCVLRAAWRVLSSLLEDNERSQTAHNTNTG